MNNKEAIDRAIERISYRINDVCNHCYENKEECNNCSEKNFYDLLIKALLYYKKAEDE